jgi:hypothetical protein
MKTKPVVMKTREPVFSRPSRLLAVAVGLLLPATARLFAASYEWTFDNGDLSTSLGNGTMTYADGATTAGLTSFGTTGGGVPNIGGQTAQYMHVPAFAAIGNGYHLTFNDTGPNGGGSYVNNYTIIFDVLVPSPWPLDYIVPFFNTAPDNSNDGDFYLYGDGEIGIGGGGYSAPNTMTPDTWYRVAFVNHGTSLSYYVNGVFAAAQNNGVSIDGTWSLYSNLDAGPDLLLFNEGDLSGQYTHELYLNSVAFIDRALTAGELSALGGPEAAGILVTVPEPSAVTFLALGLGGLAAWRFRTGRSGPGETRRG